mgnify:CR=1 FL=1
MSIITLTQDNFHEEVLSSDKPVLIDKYIFGKEIESVARQPEMKDELQSIRWLGFALTEAVAFYTFIFGLIAFFL